MLRTLFAALLLVTLNASAQSPLLPGPGLDAYIRKGIADWQIPGLAVVIVKDGQVVYQKGFGVRQVGRADSVSAQTRFMIASNSKLFTGTSLAWLEHRKRIDLDARAATYLPGFKLYDTLASAQVTVRDLLLHRLGTKTFQGDFTFLNSDLTRAQIMGKIGEMKPSSPFRYRYGYCNACYLAAGQVVEQATRRPWEAFVTDSILRPLGMSNTTALGDKAASLPGMAVSHTTAYTGKVMPIPFDTWDNLGPAASIISTAEDMGHWLLCQLDSGRYQGRRIIPYPALERTRQAGIVLSTQPSRQLPQAFRTYGLGVQISDYAGRQIFHHTGGAFGQLSSVCFVPSERLGIAILTNQDEQSFFELLRYGILDAYLGQPYVDRAALSLPRFKTAERQTLDSIDHYRELVIAAAKSKLPRPQTTLAGEWHNPFYGKLTLRATPGKRGVFEGKLEHHRVTFTLSPMADGRSLLEFSEVGYGKFAIRASAREIELKVNDFLEQDGYVFTRK